MKRPIFMIFMIGLAIRLILAPLLTYGFDMMHWALTIQHIQAGAGLYGVDGYWYTPVWGYFLGIWSFVMNLFGVVDYGHVFDEALVLELLPLGHTATVTTIPFNVMMKLPLIAADIIAGLLIYRIIKEITKDEKKATYGFALWFLCPLVIFSSSIQGMFDVVSVMFMLVAVYALMKRQDILAGSAFAAAVLTKMFPGYLIFALIAYLAVNHKGDRETFLRRVGVVSLGAVVMTAIIYIPQILDGTVMDSLAFLSARVGTAIAADTSGSTWDAIASSGMSLILFLQPLIFAAAAFFAYRMYKNDNIRGDQFFICLAATMAVVFVWPAVPQYLLVLLPFLIFMAAMFDKRFFIPFAVISIGALILDIAMVNFSMLMSVAAYTNLLDIGTVVSLAEWMDGPLIFGISKQLALMTIGGAAEVIGPLLALLFIILYEKEARHNV